MNLTRVLFFGSCAMHVPTSRGRPGVLLQQRLLNHYKLDKMSIKMHFKSLLIPGNDELKNIYLVKNVYL